MNAGMPKLPARNGCLIAWMPTRCESEPRPVSKSRLVVTRVGDFVSRKWRSVTRRIERISAACEHVHWATVADAVSFPAFVLAVFLLFWVAAALGVG